jgi:hypothetical protein
MLIGEPSSTKAKRCLKVDFRQWRCNELAEYIASFERLQAYKDVILNSDLDGAGFASVMMTREGLREVGVTLLKPGHLPDFVRARHELEKRLAEYKAKLANVRKEIALKLSFEDDTEDDAEYDIEE